MTEQLEPLEAQAGHGIVNGGGMMYNTPHPARLIDGPVSS